MSNSLSNPATCPTPWCGLALLASSALIPGAAGTGARPQDLLADGNLAAFRPTTAWHYVESVSVTEGSHVLTTDGTGSILVNSEEKAGIPYLFTQAEYRDAQVQVEFMIPKGSNSGVYLMGRYEIQILDSFGATEPKYSDLGGIYQRWDDGRDPKGYEGVAPRVNAAKAPGQWQTMEIMFRAPRFDADGKKTENARFVLVKVNGQLVHENREVTGPTRAARFNNEAEAGPLVIQGDHGPIAVRKLIVTPLQ